MGGSILNKKTLYKWLISIILLTLVISVVYYVFPKSYSATLQGVSYQLGDENKHIEKKVNVHIEGKIYNHLFDNDATDKTFKGTIKVEGEDIPVPENERELTIEFFKSGVGYIDYNFIDDGNPVSYNYGVLIVNDDFSKVSILRCGDDHYNTNTSTCWSPEDGLVITAPSNTRKEAIEIASHQLDGVIDKKIK